MTELKQEGDDFDPDDKAMWERVIKAKLPQLISLIVKRGMDRRIAEDIGADTLEKLWKYRHTLKSEDDLRAGIFVVGKQKVADYLKGNDPLVKKVVQVPPTLPLSDAESLNFEIYRRIELISRIYREIDLLPPRRRAVMLALFIDQKTVEEISIDLAMSRSTVRTHKEKAIKKLQEAFSHCSDILDIGNLLTLAAWLLSING